MSTIPPRSHGIGSTVERSQLATRGEEEVEEEER